MIVKVTIDNQTYDVEVGDLQDCPIIATIESETFEVWPPDGSQALVAINRDPVDQPPAPKKPAPSQPQAPARSAAPASRPSASADKSKAVLAPIPGVIISIAVKPGDSVVFGQELCILEAMKMKNAIRAARPGQIASVSVATGDHVSHGQILMEFTD